jgi:hypothetical protein
LKEENYRRLTEIAETCLPSAVRIVAAVRDAILNTGAAQVQFDNVGPGPMAYLTLEAPTAEQSPETVRLQAPNGVTVDRFDLVDGHAPFDADRAHLNRRSWSSVGFCSFAISRGRITCKIENAATVPVRNRGVPQILIFSISSKTTRAFCAARWVS